MIAVPSLPPELTKPPTPACPPPNRWAKRCCTARSYALELPASFTPRPLTLNESVQILGYYLEQNEVEIGLTARLTIAWQGETPAPLFVHLLDETGRIVAQADVQAIPQSEGITLSQFHLTPRRGPGNFTLRLGSGADFAEIGTQPVILAALPPATQNPVYRPVLGTVPRQTLIGYDWDTTFPAQSRLYLHWHTDDGYFSTIVDSPSAPTVEDALAVWENHGRLGSFPPPQTPPRPRSAAAEEPCVDRAARWPMGQRPYQLARAMTSTMRFVNGRPLPRDCVVAHPVGRLHSGHLHLGLVRFGRWYPGHGGHPHAEMDSWLGGGRAAHGHLPRRAANWQALPAFARAKNPPLVRRFCMWTHTGVAGQTVGGLPVVYDAFTNRPLPIFEERITAVTSCIPLGEAKIGE